KTRLEKEGVRVFDPSPLLIGRKISAGDQPLYLETDTHWRPETMEFVAQKLADFLKLPAPSKEMALTVLEKEIASRGDVAAMLKLPPTQKMYPPEKISIRQITNGNTMWRPSRHADILLLGDSFSNVFSVEA